MADRKPPLFSSHRTPSECSRCSRIPRPAIRRGAALTLLLRPQAHIGNSGHGAQAQLDFMLIAEGLSVY